MTRFVKLGSVYFRPGDVKWFRPSNYPGRITIHMIDGNEWNVEMPTQDVAKTLNEDDK